MLCEIGPSRHAAPETAVGRFRGTPDVAGFLLARPGSGCRIGRRISPRAANRSVREPLRNSYGSCHRSAIESRPIIGGVAAGRSTHKVLLAAVGSSQQFAWSGGCPRLDLSARSMARFGNSSYTLFGGKLGSWHSSVAEKKGEPWSIRIECDNRGI